MSAVSATVPTVALNVAVPGVTAEKRPAESTVPAEPATLQRTDSGATGTPFQAASTALTVCNVIVPAIASPEPGRIIVFAIAPVGAELTTRRLFVTGRSRPS